MRIFAVETLTVEDSPITLTRSIFAPVGNSRATVATIVIKGADVNFAYQTNPPTSTNSFQVGKGNTLTINGFDNIVAVNFIQLTGDTAELYVNYGN